jgi:hypothetical protein
MISLVKRTIFYNKLPYETVSAILAAYKDAASTPDKQGMVPYEKAIKLNLSPIVISLLFQVNEDSIKTLDNYDLSKHKELDLILLEKFLLYFQETHGLFPQLKEVDVHLLNKVFNTLLVANNDTEKVIDVSGVPHKSIVSRFLETFFNILLAAYPEYAQTKDEDDLLPLHKAIKHNLSEKTILKILHTYEDAAKIPDEYGTLLLHRAIESKFSDSVILSLLAANKEACKSHDNMGLLPLHKAIKQKLCDSTILRILEANEKAAKLPDRNGILSIQMAVESNRSCNVILALLKANPNFFNIVKTSDMMPIVEVEKYGILDDKVDVNSTDVISMVTSTICLPQQADNASEILQDSIMLHGSSDTSSCVETLESFSVLSMT